LFPQIATVLDPAVPAAPPPALGFALDDWRPWLLALVFLTASGTFAVLRSALLHSVSSRVLERVPGDRRRARLVPLLERADSLAMSANAFKIACDLAFAMLVLVLATGASTPGWPEIALSLLVSVPVILLVGELLPALFVDARLDAFLVRVLPAFRIVQLPFEEFVTLLEAARRHVLRLFGVRERPAAARELVEGLRDAIEDAVSDGDLGETEREIIANVLDFRDADVAEIMTPRTEVHAIQVGANLREAMAAIAESNHSRMPVYDEDLDGIAGTVAAQDLMRLFEDDHDDSAGIREAVRPAYFVPETKRVSELLTELRSEQLKMAIVLDEYGGTAGLVTVADVLAEIVGEMPDEHDGPQPAAIHVGADGCAEVDASMRVSEVNESLMLRIPEEADYETLGGYVLAELGHFPEQGETFARDDVEYTVLESSDRRVLRVRVRPPRPLGSADVAHRVGA
jgi:putative hemolysin